MVEINTIHWLPKHLAQMEEWKEICKAYDYLLKEAWQVFVELHSNMSIYNLTETGCAIWENLLSITPKKTDTLEQRRYRIQTYWAQELPYTMPKLNEMLSNLCGEDGYKITDDSKNYKITIKLGLANEENYNDVVELLERVLPANLERYVQIMWNSHNVWAVYTHDQMAAKTHAQLKTEVIE